MAYGVAFLLLALANTAEGTICYSSDPAGWHPSSVDPVDRLFQFFCRVVLVNGALLILWASGPS